MTFLTHDPTGFTEVPALSTPDRPQLDRDLTIGMLASSKGNSREFLAEMQRILRARCGVEAFVTAQSANSRATEAELDEMAARAHLVITGIGD